MLIFTLVKIVAPMNVQTHTDSTIPVLPVQTFFFFTSVGKSVLPLLQPVCHTEYYAIHEMGVLASNYLLLASLHMYRSLDKYTPSSS